MKHRRAQEGQALVEFALVSILLFALVLGIIDFSFLFSGRSSAYQATRVAARFAATHPTAWTNASTPGPTTIAGNLRLTAVSAAVQNDDAHLTISYARPGAGSASTPCGQWSVTSNAFVPAAGFSQATCVIPGTIIEVKTTYTYTFITPLLRGTLRSVAISTDATALEEI